MSKGPSLRVRLTIYPILAVVFTFISYILVLNALGFNVYFRDGKIIKERTGTIILASRPGDAYITLDGEPQTNRTPNIPFMSVQIKRLKAGTHNLTVEKSGYETWSGDIQVKPGMVSWGTQILLIPLERRAQEYSLPLSPSYILRSQDRSQLITRTDDVVNQVSTFWLVNLTNKENQKIFEVELAAGETLRPVFFASNNNRAVFEKDTNGVKSFLVYELKKNPDSWSVTGIFNLSFDKYVFNPRDYNELYALRAGSLYRLNYNNKTMSAVLDTDLTDVFVEENNLYYVKTKNDKKTLYRFVSEGNIGNVIDKLPPSESYSVKYLGTGNGYLVHVKDNKELLLYPVTNNPYQTPQKIADAVEWILPSSKNQFIGYYAAGSFYSYELEKGVTFQTLKDVAPETVDWLPDQFNLVYTKDGKVSMVTYLGCYNKQIFNAEKGTAVFASPNSARIYFFTKPETKSTVDMFVFDLLNY